MKAAIIAAGEGRRLREGGVTVPKPLVKVAGKPLIARVIDAAVQAGASSIACIVNDIHPQVRRFLDATRWPVPLERVVKTTPSSMESLFQLASLLQAEPFLLFTVDAVFRQPVLDAFVNEIQAFPDADGVLALTDHVDDEKPLWTRIDSSRRIVALGEDAPPTPYITAGFYHFSPRIFELMAEARRRRFTALRQFLGLLVASGFRLYGAAMAKTVDVDHPDDIEKAEMYLTEANGS